MAPKAKKKEEKSLKKTPIKLIEDAKLNPWQQKFTKSYVDTLKLLWTDDYEVENKLIESKLSKYFIFLDLNDSANKIQSEINNLKTEINEKTKILSEREFDAKQKEIQIQELKGKFKTLNEKQKLSHLLTRVNPAAQEKLLNFPEFRALFNQEAPCNAYVLSIDIRRSTELMLKAREPKMYAEFIISLASQLREVILNNYGIFDKFTGDGILAFFPEFYSGQDAGYFAIKAANDCHNIFAEHYEANKRCFLSVLKDIGLGIGLDYGQVQVVQIGGDFTVVGTPVVYACRMGGAEAGHTYVNQPAFEQLFEKYSAICDFDESEINIKHEGKTLAYSVKLNGKSYEPTFPDWCKPVEDNSDFAKKKEPE